GFSDAALATANQEYLLTHCYPLLDVFAVWFWCEVRALGESWFRSFFLWWLWCRLAECRFFGSLQIVSERWWGDHYAFAFECFSNVIPVVSTPTHLKNFFGQERYGFLLAVSF